MKTVWSNGTAPATAAAAAAAASPEAYAAALYAAYIQF